MWGELAARLGGGHDAELCEAALGVDLNGLAPLPRRSVSGWTSASLSRPGPGGACVRFLVPPTGTLERVEGVAEAEAEEGVHWVRIYRRPGAELGELRRGADWQGGARRRRDARGGGRPRRVRARARPAHDQPVIVTEVTTSGTVHPRRRLAATGYPR